MNDDKINPPKMKIHNPIFDLVISPDTMEKLRFDKPMTREQRRKICRQHGWEWNIYRNVEKEVRRRIEAKLNIYTGKTKE